MADSTCISCGAPLQLRERRICKRCRKEEQYEAEADEQQPMGEFYDQLRKDNPQR